MRIDASNAQIINTKDVYIHDDIMETLTFDRDNSRLEIHNLAYYREWEKYTIVFHDVIGFEMSACDFWGESPHILDMEYLNDDERTLIPRLRDRLAEEQDFQMSKLSSEKCYIEVRITFISGDTLTVACEYITTDADLGTMSFR